MHCLNYLLNAWRHLWYSQFMVNRRCGMRAPEWTHAWSLHRNASGLFYCTRGENTGCTATTAVAEGPLLAMRAHRPDASPMVLSARQIRSATVHLPAVSDAARVAAQVAVATAQASSLEHVTA